jgi:hypothetical protein
MDIDRLGDLHRVRRFFCSSMDTIYSFRVVSTKPGQDQDQTCSLSYYRCPERGSDDNGRSRATGYRR